jgi:hypothetical protein
VIAGYGKLPLHFEANQGQTDDQVRFLARGSGYGLFLTPTESVLALHKPEGSPAVLRMKLLGANPRPVVKGREELPGKSNYFIGNDPKKWRTNVPQFARVEYEEVYRGVSLAYYGNQGQIEYDFVVNPGADPKRIRLGIEGADAIHVDADGNLVLSLPDGEVVQRAPVVYQEVDGVRTAVDGRFVLTGKQEVRFEVGTYEPDRPLVLDPLLVYSTYLGGSGGETGFGLAADVSGNAYVTGYTYSSDFPMANPRQGFGGGEDAFIAKLNPEGSAFVYSSYLGGSGADRGFGIAADASGNAYVTGWTGSIDFPVADAVQAASGGIEDVFVAKLNPTGSMLTYSTYLGGSGSDYGRGIAVDTSGNVCVTGWTLSTNFPTVNPRQPSNGGAYDAFVAKLNTAGSALVYSTYLGGSLGDRGNAIAVDASGNAYVTGVTQSTSSGDFPTANPFQATHGGGFEDGFVAKLSASGSALLYSTYVGGNGSEEGTGMAVDASGNAYVTGFTESTNFPMANPLQTTNGGGPYDAFVAKLNPAGSALTYSTYLGGGGLDQGHAIAVDSSARAYITGTTTSTDLPTLNPFQAAHGGGYADAFVAKLNSAGSALLYSSYLGGSAADEGYGIGVDALGNAYVTGVTVSADFPTATPVQATHAGGTDAFVTKIGPGASPPAIAINDVSVTEGNTGTSAVFTVSLSGSSAQTVTVNFATANGMALAGSDYTAVSGTLTFAPGVTVQTVSVPVIGDLVDEDDETFLVNLSGAVNATILDGQGVGTILDDDPPPVMSIDDCAVNEGNAGSVVCGFTVSLSAPSSRTITVNYATANGTATAGSDYNSASGGLTFTPGQVSKPVDVTVLGDAAVEVDEDFVVNLTGAVDATVGDAQGRGTILDDDAPSLASNELVHGAMEMADLAADPGPVADVDLYRLAQDPRASYEVVVDATSGDVDPVVVERLGSDNTTVLQTAVAVGTGSSRSLPWENVVPGKVTGQHIRVRSGGCTTDCGTDDVYRIRAYETTYAIPRFNNAGSQVTVLLLQNPSSYTISGHAYFWDGAGALLYSHAFSIGPKGLFGLSAAGIPALQAKGGTITVSNDGRYGDLTGRAIGLEPATGFSFDSPMVPRPR